MGGYVMVPGWLLDLRPDGAELRVYCALARFGRFDTARGCYEECRPSIPTLAEAAGLSESHAKRALGRLLDKKAIERRLRFDSDGKTPLPSVYRVIFGSLVGPAFDSGGEPTGSTDEPTPGATGEPRVGPPADGNQEPPTQNQDTQKRERASRGARLPEDFGVSDSMRSWFVDKQYGRVIDGVAEHEKFVDYWRGNGRAMKDWEATWRNWMRRAAERAGGRPSAPTSGAPAGAPRYPTAAERSAAALDREAEVARVAEAIVESRGGDPESFTEVSPVMARLKADAALLATLLPVLAVPVPEQAAWLQKVLHEVHEQQNGSASRTPDMYSGGNGYIDGQVASPREVTSHASE